MKKYNLPVILLFSSQIKKSRSSPNGVGKSYNGELNRKMEIHLRKVKSAAWRGSMQGCVRCRWLGAKAVIVVNLMGNHRIGTFTNGLFGKHKSIP